MAKRGDNGEKSSSQQDYDAIARTADRMKLSGKDRTKYIHDHMTRFGYRAVASYVDPDDDEDDNDGGFFGRSSRRRSGRDDEDDGYPF